MRVLVFARDGVFAAILDEVGACLVERERHMRLGTLGAEVQHPVEVQGARVFPGLAPDRDGLDERRVQVLAQVHALKHGSRHHKAMPYGQRQENRKPEVRAVLILYGTAYRHIVISVAPVRGQAPCQAVDAFREKEKSAVVPAAYHVPDCRAPHVCLLYQEVRGETQSELCAGREFPVLAAVAPYGHVERGGLADLARGLPYPEGRVLSVDVAMSASLAYLVAAMPRIPHGHAAVSCKG